MRKPRRSRGQQFRGHEVGPAVSQGKLQGAEHHGKGGRDAELRENLPVVGAICAGHLDKGRVGHAHADVGVDDAGHDTRDPDDEYLTGEADAEPENGKRNPRDGGDGTDKFEDRAEQTFNHVEPAHGQTERDTHDEREHIPGEASEWTSTRASP